MLKKWKQPLKAGDNKEGSSGFYLALILFIVSIVFDYLTKRWGESLSSVQYNHGIFLGVFSNAPPSLRIVTLCSAFGFIFFVYLTLIYLLPAEVRKVKYGISLLAGGMFGNVLDKIFLAKTVDFIPVKLGSMAFYFNFADVFQVLGAGLTLFYLVKLENDIWHPKNLRARYVVYLKEQVRYGLKFFAISICTAFLLGIFSYTYVKTYLSRAVGVDVQEVLSTYIISYFILALVFSLFVFLAGLFVSHKTAGPIYAFEKYVDEITRGKNTRLVLRQGDYYKHLETVARRLSNYIRKSDSKSS